MIWAGTTWWSGVVHHGRRYQKLTTVWEDDSWYKYFDFSETDWED